MPELPEVERARALIAGRALGRRIEAVDDRDEWVCRPHAPGEIAHALTGATLTRAHRRGKTMWVETDADVALGLHLGMAGRVVIDGAAEGDPPGAGEPATREPAGRHPRGWDRFALRFADGGGLALRDKRRLGRVRLDPDLSGLGPDAAEISRAAFRSAVGDGQTPVKARIMDQSVIAGVGNLLADEALRAATRDAIRHGGVHTGRLIPARRRGGTCPRCATPLQRATIGGRTTWWCPQEQR